MIKHHRHHRKKKQQTFEDNDVDEFYHYFGNGNGDGGRDAGDGGDGGDGGDNNEPITPEPYHPNTTPQPPPGVLWSREKITAVALASVAALSAGSALVTGLDAGRPNLYDNIEDLGDIELNNNDLDILDEDPIEDPIEDPLYGEDEVDPEMNQPFEGEPSGGGDMEMTEVDPFNTTLSEDIDQAIAEAGESGEGVEAVAEATSFWSNAWKGVQGFFDAAKEIGADAGEIAANIGEVTSGATQLATGSSELAEVAGGIAEATELGSEFIELGI